MRLRHVLAGLLAVPCSAHAVEIPVLNPGFESPAIAAGTFQTNAAPPGWTDFGDVNFSFRTVGVLDPTGTTLYPAGAPEGENVGVVFLLDDQGDQTSFAGSPAGLEQTLGAVLETATTYTLTVEVGNIADDTNPPHDAFEFAGFPGYRVELLAGGTPVAFEDGGPLPPEGGFVTVQVTLAVGGSHERSGQDLGIRLVNLNAAPGLEVNFDDVRLVAEAAPEPVPTVGRLAGLVLVCVLVVFVVRRSVTHV